jgi:uncharacterized protein
MTTTAISTPGRSRGLRDFGKRLLLGGLVAYVCYCAFFYFQQDQLTFPAPNNDPKASPTDADIPFEDLHLPVNRSEQIHAWWIPAADPTDKVVVAFHGNGYVIEREFGADRALFEASPLHRLGVNLLLVEYRGYGSSSPVTPSEKHLYEDAEAAFRYLTVQRNLPARDIVVFGRSIGTGPATELAKRHPDVAGLMLMSPFTSLLDAAKGVWYLRALPLSIRARNHFDNLSRISDVHVPVLIMVGTDDRLTPPSMSQALFRKANQPKQIYLQPGAGHEDMVDMGGQKLEDQMRAFIRSLR